MPISPGDKLGPYEILAPIGAGGMGEVYRAKDTKLGREVAIKVLPAAFAQHPERLARFEREAKVLASLNHPNIAQIYGLEESSAGRALVIELVQGETLEGPVPLDTALQYAAQIASALDAAHEKGIIHRDLKPANIMLTPEGVIKVLDFGLAAVTQSSRESQGDPNHSPTLTIGATQAGTIVGTAAYMSPEQARGKIVDRRADIWSFGVVLFEMLTGKRLYHGETVSDVLASVIKEEPDWKPIPPSVLKLLKACLEKDPKMRLQSIGDWRYLLSEEQAVPQAIPHASKMPWVIAAAAVVGFAFLAALHFHESPPVEQLARLQLPVPGSAQRNIFELSPDGRFLASTEEKASGRLFVRPVDSLGAQALPGTEGARYPIWSPDGTAIAFFAQGKLKKIALTGGTPQVLCDVPDGHGGAWSEDGVILFSPSSRSGLQKVQAVGGIPVLVTTLGATGDSHRYPIFLPGGRRFLYVASTDKPETSGVYAGSLEGGSPVRLLSEVSNVAFAPAIQWHSSYLLLRHENTLMAQLFDPQTLKLNGEMIPLATDVSSNGNTFHGAFSVSANGLLAYSTGDGVFGAPGNFVWMDRSGKRLSDIGTPGNVNFVSLSPDGKTVGAIVVTDGHTDIWLGDTTRGLQTRFTFGVDSLQAAPVWSPDGGRIAFSSRDPKVSRYQISIKPVSGAGQQVVYEAAAANVWPYDWSPDGKFLLFGQDLEKSKRDLWLLPLEGDRKPVPFLQTPFNETNPRFSPDGKWIAYASDESGGFQVYVQPFPATGAKFQLSIGGGDAPRWRGDGRELYYISANGKLVAVPVKIGATFEASPPIALFDTNLASGLPLLSRSAYAPSPDGQRFLLNAPKEGAAASPITVVMHWQAGFKK
jgi:serine/threonine protein kinase